MTWKDRLLVVTLVIGLHGLWPRANAAAAQGLMQVMQGAPGASTAPWFVTLVPATAGSGYKKFGQAVTNAVQTVKSGPTTLTGYFISNVDNASTASCLQLFDQGSNATITLGTTVPDARLKLPGGGSANIGIPAGIAFTNGLRVAAATTCTGSTAPGSSLDVTLWYF